jgi:hypothetical protein
MNSSKSSLSRKPCLPGCAVAGSSPARAVTPRPESGPKGPRGARRRARRRAPRPERRGRAQRGSSRRSDRRNTRRSRIAASGSTLAERRLADGSGDLEGEPPGPGKPGQHTEKPRPRRLFLPPAEADRRPRRGLQLATPALAPQIALGLCHGGGWCRGSRVGRWGKGRASRTRERSTSRRLDGPPAGRSPSPRMTR